MDQAAAVSRYLRDHPDCPPTREVRFLAAGEYNQNYLVDTNQGRLVLRVNHGSQLGLGPGQIGYEFRVLRAVHPSGVTPRPLFCDPTPEGLPGGVLMMEYLPGQPLDYATQLERAARIFARVHALPPDQGLITQADPVADLATESRGLLDRYPDHPRPEVGRRLDAYHDQVLELRDQTWHLFRDEPLVMANTEVNSGNFLMGPQGDYLVDWEKAVITPRHQDLGHFLVETTTRWKAGVTLDPARKAVFLEAYRRELQAAGGPRLDPADLALKTRVLERAILLRALSWCYMAYYEYTRTDRALCHPDTLAKIKEYLDESACWLPSRT